MNVNPFHEEKLQGDEQEILAILGKYGLHNLAYVGDPGRNPGYIFRGELDYPIPLQCGLERQLRGQPSTVINGDKLRSEERTTLTCFLRSQAGKTAGIFYQFKPGSDDDLRKEVFWWLSLMQHYKHHFNLRTRLVDFSRDIRMALYFATEQQEQRQDLDMVIYCFPCKDPKSNYDPDNNKCPFVLKEGLSDMNLALGVRIGLEWMEEHKAKSDQYEENKPPQKWGWDRPYYPNPRLCSQQGMFVYPYDYPELLKLEGPSWLIGNLLSNDADPFNLGSAKTEVPPKRLVIPRDRAKKLREHLDAKYGISAKTVYPDRHFLRD